MTKWEMTPGCYLWVFQMRKLPVIGGSLVSLRWDRHVG